MTGPRRPAQAAKERRRDAVNALKRELIRDAAKSLFSEHGLGGTSVREIARAAGYTTGAIYFHYAGKEEIYADILRRSLDLLRDEVHGAAAAEPDAAAALAAAFRALVRFYDRNPRDLDLGLYLFHGARPQGLSADLDRDLNERLLAVLAIFDGSLARLGVEPGARRRIEVASLFSEMIGLLVTAHTGRLKVLGVDADAMLEHHAARLLARWAPGRPGEDR